MSSFKTKLKNFFVTNNNQYFFLKQKNLNKYYKKEEKKLHNKIENLNKEYSKIKNDANAKNWQSIFDSKDKIAKILKYQESFQKEKSIKENTKNLFLEKKLEKQKKTKKIQIQTIHNHFIQKQNIIQIQHHKNNNKIECFFSNKIQKIETQLEIIENKKIKEKINFSQEKIILDQILNKQNIYYNNKINLKNKELQQKTEYLLKEFEINKKNLEKIEKQNSISFDQKNDKINEIYQKKLVIHYNIFDKIQKNFINKKDNLENKIKIFFMKQKKIPIITDYLNISHKYIDEYLKNLLLEVKKNNFLNLKKLTLWRQKYFLIKISNKKNNNICNLINDLEIKKLQNKKKQKENIFLKKKIKNKLLNLIEIAFIQFKFKLSINHNKEQKFIIDNKKQKIQLEIKNKKINLEKEKKIILNKLEYEKNFNDLNKFFQEKENLINLQIKLEKNKFYFQDKEEIIKHKKKIIKIENQIEDLEFFNIIDQKINNISCLQEKKNFLTKFQIQKNKIKNFIEQKILEKKFIYKQIFNFVFYKNKNQNFIENFSNIILEEIKEKLNKIKNKIEINNENILEENLNSIENSYKLLLNNIIDNKYKNYYFLYEKKYFLDQKKINIEIEIIKKIIIYYENNLSFIKQLIQKNKNILDNNKYNINNEIEKKIKKYEKNNFILINKLNKLKNKIKILKINFQNKIQNLKKEQIQIIQKNNNLQLKLFQKIQKQNNINKNKNFLTKIKNKIIQKKILKTIKKIEKNINFIYENDIFNKNNIDKIHIFLKKEEKENIFVKNNLIDQYTKKIEIFFNLITNIIDKINIINEKYKNKEKLQKKSIFQKQKKQTIKKINQKIENMKLNYFLLEENLKEAISNIRKKLKEKQKKLWINFQNEEKKIKIQFKKNIIYLQKIKKADKNNYSYTIKNFQKNKKQFLNEFEQKKNDNNNLIKNINNNIKKLEKEKKTYFLKIKIFLIIIYFYFKYIVKKLEIIKNQIKNKKNIKKQLKKEKQIYCLK